MAGLGSGSETLEAARRRAAERRGIWLAQAHALSSARAAASRRLGEALARELAALAMGPCEVDVRVAPAEPPEGAPAGRDGIDEVDFLLSPNPGEPPRPLAEIASGGELSRVMLAVNTVLGTGRRRRTLVFDEVDAGIGGRTAGVVGEKLRSLASAHQVIVVTHLPQIASLADAHFAVEKKVSGGRTVVQVRALDREGRVAEIARMMGGGERSTAARRHAQDMLRRPGGRAERRTT
jgi:DNA repair protein RecN (Recombination protein N)